jgi:hypothetical protein
MKISLYPIAGMANDMTPRKVYNVLAIMLGLGLRNAN